MVDKGWKQVWTEGQHPAMGLGRGGTSGGGRPAANDTGTGQQRVEKRVGTGSRGKGAGGLPAVWYVGNPALCELPPRSGACD